MCKVLSIKGTPYEQGIQEGKHLKSVIQKNMTMLKDILDDQQVDMEKYMDFINMNAEYLGKECPEIIEEIRGIACGSSQEFDDILMLNIPAYFMKEHFWQECSMILARGRSTLDGKTYIIKNRDMHVYLEQALINREYPDGMRIAEVNGVGTVTYPACGINSHGLGVTTTGMWSERASTDVDRVGVAQVVVNSHLILRNCRTAKEGLEYLLDKPRINGLNMIIADSNSAFLIELTKNDAYVYEDDAAGLLFRTNHYISEKFAWLSPSPEKYPSTYSRFERIKDMLEEIYGNIRLQDLIRIMSDHENGENSICRHPVDGNESKTVSSSIVILEDQELWTTLGNPCSQFPHISL